MRCAGHITDSPVGSARRPSMDTFSEDETPDPATRRRVRMIHRHWMRHSTTNKTFSEPPPLLYPVSVSSSQRWMLCRTPYTHMISYINYLTCDNLRPKCTPNPRTTFACILMNKWLYTHIHDFIDPPFRATILSYCVRKHFNLVHNNQHTCSIFNNSHTFRAQSKSHNTVSVSINTWMQS